MSFWRLIELDDLGAQTERERRIVRLATVLSVLPRVPHESIRRVRRFLFPSVGIGLDMALVESSAVGARDADGVVFDLELRRELMEVLATGCRSEGIRLGDVQAHRLWQTIEPSLDGLSPLLRVEGEIGFLWCVYGEQARAEIDDLLRSIVCTSLAEGRDRILWWAGAARTRLPTESLEGEPGWALGQLCSSKGVTFEPIRLAGEHEVDLKTFATPASGERMMGIHRDGVNLELGGRFTRKRPVAIAVRDSRPTRFRVTATDPSTGNSSTTMVDVGVRPVTIECGHREVRLEEVGGRTYVLAAFDEMPAPEQRAATDALQRAKQLVKSKQPVKATVVARMMQSVVVRIVKTGGTAMVLGRPDDFDIGDEILVVVTAWDDPSRKVFARRYRTVEDVAVELSTAITSQVGQTRTGEIVTFHQVAGGANRYLILRAKDDSVLAIEPIDGDDFPKTDVFDGRRTKATVDTATTGRSSVLLSGTEVKQPPTQRREPGDLLVASTLPGFSARSGVSLVPVVTDDMLVGTLPIGDEDVPTGTKILGVIAGLTKKGRARLEPLRNDHLVLEFDHHWGQTVTVGDVVTVRLWLQRGGFTAAAYLPGRGGNQASLRGGRAKTSNSWSELVVGEVVSLRPHTVTVRIDPISLGTGRRLWERLRVGERRIGQVTSVVNFGVFVDLGGIEGLVHQTEYGWSGPDLERYQIAVGDEMEVEVIDVDVPAKRIRLSRKAVLPDPFLDFVENVEIGQVVEGVVSKTVAFGVFVAVAEQLDGLVHVSEIPDDGRGAGVDRFDVGQRLRVRLIGVDLARRRISLSLRTR